ncbi:hypothetical protein INT43_003578, partial [Umbelopsis isabellina]
MRLSVLLIGVAAYHVAAVLASPFVHQLDFRTPKNIGISVLAPGSSHTVWVLEIGQELARRGHNVTFLCKIENEKYTKDYPDIKLHSAGKSHFNVDLDEMSKSATGKDFCIDNTKAFFQAAQSGFREDYLLHAKYMQEQRPDVMICDMLADACVRATDEYNIPLALASTLAHGSDSDAPFVNDFFLGADPTTEHESIWTRFNNKFIFTAKLMWSLKPVLEEGMQARKELGLKSASQIFAKKIDHSIKLVNNIWGMEIPRAVGPLIRFIGPIMQSKYPNMDFSTSQFLDTHQKVAYIAFGNHATPTPEEFAKILAALVDSVDSKVIDGFIWATVKASTFPEVVQTAKGQQLNATDIIYNPNQYPHYKFLKWAPQFAILSHPSSVLFLTHGGANSLYEGLYTGKKLLIHPFFADQPINAKKLTADGLALTNDRINLQVSAIRRDIRLLVEDEGNQFTANIKRTSNLVQLKASDAVSMAAAAVEEVAFASKGDKLPHLITGDHNMTYMKAHNYDLYLLLAIVLLFVTGFLITVIYMGIKFLLNAFAPKQKNKK